MLNRILVAYDGSTLAREAFAYAAMLAESSAATVHAIHVIEPMLPTILAVDPAVALDPMLPAVMLPTWTAESRGAERAWATRAFEELRAYADARDIPFQADIFEGELAPTLMKAAESADLITLGRKGRFTSAGIGSLTRSLVTSCKTPVMVVSGPLHPVNRVLAVYDATPRSRFALDFARTLAAATRWPLTVLALARKGISLDDAAAQAQAHAGDGVMVIPLPDDAHDGEAALIARFEASDNYALLVMGAYTDSWIRDAFTGSVTDRVVRNVRGPVILVHDR